MKARPCLAAWLLSHWAWALAVALCLPCAGALGGPASTRFSAAPEPDLGSSPENLYAHGGYLYFSADDGIHGREPWVVGTGGTPFLLGDFNPGPAGSNPRAFISHQGRLYFVAKRFNSQEDAERESVWSVGEGLASVRCHLPRDDAAGRIEAIPGDLTLVSSGEHLLVAATPRGGSRALFACGAAMASSPLALCGEGLLKSQEYFASLGGQCIVALQPRAYPSSRGLCVLDPASGRSAWLERDGETGFFVLFAGMAEGRLWFCGGFDGKGMELHVTDGTAQGTRFVKDINPGLGDSMPKDFSEHGGIVYFQANDGEHGIELWRTDGTSEGTWMVKDINPGPPHSSPYHIRGLGEGIVFAARRDDVGAEMWFSDGTREGTRLLHDIYPGPGSSNPYQPVRLKGALLFSADHPVHGEELWRTDGTPDGTYMLRDIHADAGLSEPYHLTEFAGMVYFSANDGVRGEELWCSDGTPEGTRLVADIRPPMRAVRSSNPTGLVCAGDRLYFAADGPQVGDELWCADNATGTVTLAADIWTGPDSAHPRDMTYWDGGVVFTADDGVHGREPWLLDEKNGSARLLADLAEGSASSRAGLFVPCEEELFFAADGAAGSGVYRIRAGSRSAEVLAELDAMGLRGSAARMRVHDGVLYGCDSTDPQFYRFFSFEARTETFQVLPYALRAAGAWSEVQRLVGHGKQEDAVDGGVLLQCYLTLPGMAGRYCRENGRWYFAAYDDAHGSELWTSGGGVEDASLLKDCLPGKASGGPRDLLSNGKYLFFSASAPGGRRALWAALLPGGVPFAAPPRLGHDHAGIGAGDLVVRGGNVYYTAEGHGVYAGRRVLSLCGEDASGLSAGMVAEVGRHWPIEAGPLVPCGDSIYFAAEHPANGRELWRFRSLPGESETRVSIELAADLAADAGYAADTQAPEYVWRFGAPKPR